MLLDWVHRTTETVGALQRLCRDRARHACDLRRLSSSADLEDVASTCVLRAIERLDDAPPPAPLELLEAIERAANTRAAQLDRWRRRERAPDRALERDTHAPTLPSEWRELRAELLTIVRQALGELQRGHPRYAADWEAYLFASSEIDERGWPARRSVEALRAALLDVLDRRAAAEARAGVADGLSAAMASVLRGTGTKSRYARALHQLLDFLGPPKDTEGEA